MKKIYVLLLISLSSYKVIAQTTLGLGQGPFSGTSATNAACSFSFISSVGYTPANNVLGSDNQYATASHCDCCDQNTQCLIVSGFGFNIPTNTTIKGIALKIEKKRSVGGSGIVVDNGIQLMKNGIQAGQDKKDATKDWPIVDSAIYYGSGSDLWNTTWTAADINASNFGVAIASISYVCGATITTYIDDVQLTVSYANATTGVIETASSTGKIIAYPNPVVAGNKISFSEIKTIDELIIFDVTGKQVFTSSSENNELIIPELTAGLYFYTIKANNTNSTGKLIIR